MHDFTQFQICAVILHGRCSAYNDLYRVKAFIKNPPPYYLHESRNSNCIQNHITRGEEITERKKKDEEQKHGQETS